MKSNLSRIVAVIPQTNGKYGVENLKVIFSILVMLTTNIVRVFKSGNWTALLGAFVDLLKYGNIVAIATVAWNEFRELSTEEAQEVTDHIKMELVLDDKEVEMRIEEAIQILPDTYELVGDVLGLTGRAQDIWARLRAIFAQEEEEGLA